MHALVTVAFSLPKSAPPTPADRFITIALTVYFRRWIRRQWTFIVLLAWPWHPVTSCGFSFRWWERLRNCIVVNGVVASSTYVSSLATDWMQTCAKSCKLRLNIYVDTSLRYYSRLIICLRRFALNQILLFLLNILKTRSLPDYCNAPVL